MTTEKIYIHSAVIMQDSVQISFAVGRGEFGISKSGALQTRSITLSGPGFTPDERKAVTDILMDVLARNFDQRLADWFLRGCTADCVHPRNGYQPTIENADQSSTPQGGSGVPTQPRPGEMLTDAESREAYLRLKERKLP